MCLLHLWIRQVHVFAVVLYGDCNTQFLEIALSIQNFTATYEILN